MRLPVPLRPGRLVRRYQRFLANVALDDGGGLVTAHCPNPGRMMGLSAPGLEVWLSRAADPRRKLGHTLELVRLPAGDLVGIHTGRPNALAAEAIRAGRIPELAGYPILRREVRYGAASRVDLLLDGAEGRPPCHVEVKNVHLRRADGPFPDAAEFPDCVTARGARHLAELSRVVAAGGRAVMLFIVQRGDCRHFRIAGDLDPAYLDAFGRAGESGVETLCYSCRVTLDGIEVAGSLPVEPAGATRSGEHDDPRRRRRKR